MTVIYNLRCPISGELRYVGKTIEPGQRLRSHISKAKSAQTNHHCAHWIRQLLSVGVRPALDVILQVPDGESWQDYEKRMIAEYREAGHRLTNLTGGGDGFYGVPREVIDRAAATRKVLTWDNPENRRRQIEAMQAGRTTPEAIVLLVESIKASWVHPETRARYLAGMHQPEAIARRSAATSKRNNEPVYWAIQREKAKEPRRVAQLLDAAAAARANPEMEAKRAAAIKKAYENPEAKANLAAAMAEVNARPEVKQKRADTLLRRMADPEQHKVLCERTPETRAKMSESATKRWADPVKAKAAKEALNTPERIQRRAEMAVWKASPEYRAMRATKGRAERAVKKAERELAKLKAEAEDRASRLL